MNKYNMNLRQVLHKKCGGEIILISDKTKIVNFACKDCKEMWKTTVLAEMSDDMRLLTSRDNG